MKRQVRDFTYWEGDYEEVPVDGTIEIGSDTNVELLECELDETYNSGVKVLIQITDETSDLNNHKMWIDSGLLFKEKEY